MNPSAPSINPTSEPRVGIWFITEKFIIGSAISMEVMDMTLTIQMFLNARRPSMYPESKNKTLNTITGNALIKIAENLLLTEEKYLAAVTSASIESTSPAIIKINE
jgi:hypothetical protein